MRKQHTMLSSSYARSDLSHGRDLRDTLLAERDRPAASTSPPPPQIRVVQPAGAPQPRVEFMSAAHQFERQLLEPPRPSAVDWPPWQGANFLSRLEAAEARDAHSSPPSRTHGLLPESRSPPNFPQGRYSVQHKDSCLLPRCDVLPHHGRRPGQVRAELW